MNKSSHKRSILQYSQFTHRERRRANLGRPGDKKGARAAAHPPRHVQRDRRRPLAFGPLTDTLFPSRRSVPISSEQASSDLREAPRRTRAWFPQTSGQRHHRNASFGDGDFLTPWPISVVLLPGIRISIGALASRTVQLQMSPFPIEVASKAWRCS